MRLVEKAFGRRGAHDETEGKKAARDQRRNQQHGTKRFTKHRATEADRFPIPLADNSKIHSPVARRPATTPFDDAPRKPSHSKCHNEQYGGEK